VLAVEVEQLPREGWEPETDVGYGTFFVRRGGERVQVGLQAVAPDAPLYGPALRVAW
jgi:hypothetical protein